MRPRSVHRGLQPWALPAVAAQQLPFRFRRQRSPAKEVPGVAGWVSQLSVHEVLLLLSVPEKGSGPKSTNVDHF